MYFALFFNTIAIPQRDLALALSSIMLRCFGSSFLLAECSKPWVIFVQIVCAEVRVLLDQIDSSGKESEDTRADHMLPVCLEIMHEVVKYLVLVPEEDAKKLLLLESTQQALVDTILALVAYLDDVYANYELALVESGDIDSSYLIMDCQNVILSLRVVSEWVAEETEMPKKELKSVLKCAVLLCDKG
jgi:hypothetical protein